VIYRHSRCFSVPGHTCCVDQAHNVKYGHSARCHKENEEVSSQQSRQGMHATLEMLNELNNKIITFSYRVGNIRGMFARRAIVADGFAA